MTHNIYVDKLDSLFIKQTDFQTKQDNIPFKSFKEKQEFINLMCLSCMDELSESLRETAWKNPKYVSHGWKKHQAYDEEKFKEELIDLWHFVINLSIASGMNSEELFERFNNKNKINHERQKNEY